jgi:hypothetical protein
MKTRSSKLKTSSKDSEFKNELKQEQIPQSKKQARIKILVEGAQHWTKKLPESRDQVHFHTCHFEK